ncbi:MAG TPA: sensor histidine kinase, partial [Gammaproteobacteria bacterium]|nr:sensor histidine kinase [Gammaproteobacteria bacterium]
PYRNDKQPQWNAEGPDIRLNPKAALALGMALHELATNAAKYGALAAVAGCVELRWRVRRAENPDDRALHLSWVEHDGPRVKPPVRRGFGTRLIEEGLAYELGAEVHLGFKPAGVRCTIDMPLAAVAASAVEPERV